jgi:hypothetical protein
MIGVALGREILGHDDDGRSLRRQDGRLEVVVAQPGQAEHLVELRVFGVIPHGVAVRRRGMHRRRGETGFSSREIIFEICGRIRENV